MCKFSAYVEFSAYFYLYPETIAGCDSLSVWWLLSKEIKAVIVLAYDYRLSVELIKTYASL